MKCFAANVPVASADIGVDFSGPPEGATLVIRGHLCVRVFLAAGRALMPADVPADLTELLRRLRKDDPEPVLRSLFPPRSHRPRYVLRSLDELRISDERVVFTARATEAR